MARSQCEQGAALLSFLLIVVVGASSLLINVLSGRARHGEQQAVYATHVALNTAREALIGYAITFPDTRNPLKYHQGPGYLLCPDTNNDGQSEGSCALGSASRPTIGRFPSKTLGTGELRDASGEHLWYALSTSYRSFNSANTRLSSETRGQLTVKGSDDIVAVIISPGAPLDGQNREAANGHDPTRRLTHYLEGDNGDLDQDFMRTEASHRFNDRVMALTRQSLMEVVERRVLNTVARSLERHRTAHGYYPWLIGFHDFDPGDIQATPEARQGHLPAIYHDGTVNNDIEQWFFENGWDRQVYIAYAPTTGLPGGTPCEIGKNCLELRYGDGHAVQTGIHALAIIAGGALDGQDRTPTRPPGPDDYFENGNAAHADGRRFHLRATTAEFNDQIKVVATVN